MFQLLIILALLVFLGWILTKPIKTVSLRASHPNPVKSYAEALARIDALNAEEQAQGVADYGLSRLLTHGQPTEYVVVFLHGFTNCPQQFLELGKRVFELGSNVFIPLAPYHGRQDRLTKELSKLTAEDLAAYGDRAIDIAQGLGQKVMVAGISGGGTITCWLAQNRNDIDTAVPIASMLGVSFVPARLTYPFARVFHSLPDRYMWWDPRTKADNPYAVYYSYPGYPVHAMSEVLRLGVSVRDQAKQSAPRAKRVITVINDKEPAVNNTELRKLNESWKSYGTMEVETIHLDKGLKLPHDIITPETPGLDINIVYDQLMSRVRAIIRPQ